MSESTSSFKSLEFTWKITSYRLHKFMNESGKCIRSQAYPADCEGNFKFTLQFYPQGAVKSGETEDSDEEKWASVYLNTEGSKEYDTFHHIEFSILDADGEKFGIQYFHKQIPFEGVWGFRNFIRLADLENPANNLLQNDTLTIYCRVLETKSETEECDCDCPMEKTKTTIARRKLCEDLASLLDEKYADFVFKVENEKIPAHRAILGARSPVFDAMFQHDMKETKTNETEIKDVTPAAFRSLLRFIYTGHCEVGDLAEEILAAANKYDIEDLKQMCAKKLRKKLTADNAVHLLILSDLHQSEDLKDGAIRFINENAAIVMKTPSWSKFPKSHQHLIFELYSKLVESK